MKRRRNVAMLQYDHSPVSFSSEFSVTYTISKMH